MIAKLKGRVDEIGEDWVILDVGGVGYQAFCSSRSLSALPGVGEAATLFIEMLVREDLIQLFGFASRDEKDAYRLLSTVQGVGAKVALAILSVLSPEMILTAIAAQDKTAFTRASGVGPKLAQRLVTELKDKAAKLGFASAGGVKAALVAEAGAATVTAPATSSAADEAVSALTNLGYARMDAFTAVAAAASGGETTVDGLIKVALKQLGSGR